MRNLIDVLQATHVLSRDACRDMLSQLNAENLSILQEKARETVQGIYGNKIFIRGLIEFTNHCKQNCHYCGLRAENKKVSRYRLTEDEILACCDTGDALGFRTFVLQGGEDPYFNDERMVALIHRIKEKYPNTALTLSLGVRSAESYHRLHDAGADRYLLRHETADAAHFATLHPPEQSFAQRKAALYALREAGFVIGAGMMIGSPGQTIETLTEDLMFLQALRPEMIGVGPFLPQHETPLGSYPKGSITTTLGVLSILRLLLPNVLLPATTAVGTAETDGRALAVLSGANVIMPNLSPLRVRDKYAIYDNKLHQNEEAAEGLAALKRQMAHIGYDIVADRGDPKEWEATL